MAQMRFLIALVWVGLGWVGLGWVVSGTVLAVHSEPGGTPTVPTTKADLVALVPLDSRPATSTLPGMIGAAGKLEVNVPNLEHLGNATRPTDAQAVLAGVDQADPITAIVSLDALAYGGLVQSRTSRITADDAWDKLWPVWLMHLSRQVWAFMVIPRFPDAVDRERNLSVIRRAIDWAEDGTITRLYIAWDDALSGSPAPAEGQALRDDVAKRGLNNVIVYPGADEVASVMVARLALDRAKLRPRVRVRFSDPDARTKIVPYEGQSLEESVTNQAQALGLEVTDADADFEIYVYNGGDARKAGLEVTADQRRLPVALADVQSVNRANLTLAGDLVLTGAFADLAAFAAWGTPGNNIGTALSQGAMRALAGGNRAAYRLLAFEYANDYLYSSFVRAEIRQTRLESAFSAPDANSELYKRVSSRLGLLRLGGYVFTLEDAVFPWGRSFEARLSVTDIPASLGDCPKKACVDP
jgi:Protein of unknown function (DUF4127)